MIQLQLALDIAKQWHTKEPFDAGHDWDHHQEVIRNAEWLIEAEGLGNGVNKDLVLIAASWHDFRRGSDDFSVLVDELTSLGASEEFIQEVMYTIGGHSFGENQETTEQKVLFDSDKLAYVSIPRILKVHQAVLNGDMTPEKIERYGFHFRERIPQVPSLLHFDSARHKFEHDVAAFQRFVLTDPELKMFVL